METETLESINIITKGTVIKGDVTSTGDFRLDGTLEGNIQLNGKLVVGDTGIVNGNLSVKELLSLHATARVKGDILINKLSIEPGAVFTGKCCMLDEVRKQQQLDAEHAAAEQAAAEHMANED